MDVLIRRTILVLLVLVAGGTAIWLVVGILQQEPVEDSIPNKVAGVSLAFEDFSYANYDGATLLSRLRAGQLVVVPKKISIFEVGSLKEIVLTQVRFYIYRQQEVEIDERASNVRSSNDNLFSGMSEGIMAIASAKAVGRVVNATLYKVEIIVENKKTTTMRVDAERGYIKINKKKFGLINVVFKNDKNGIFIKTDNAEWSEEDNAFRIEGKYELQNGHEIKRGTGLLVDLDNNIRGLQAQREKSQL